LPDNPSAWLFKVCKNKTLNRIKGIKRFSDLFIDKDVYPADPVISKLPLDDRQLILLFSSAHPGLSLKVQVVITLKYMVLKWKRLRKFSD
jgi:predicted RNA polymerase sigma factor